MAHLYGELLDAAASAKQTCPFVITKFEMGESRFLNDRYGLRGLPMYLVYYAGKLVYASPSFTTMDKTSIKEQVRVVVSLLKCKRSSFFFFVGCSCKGVWRTASADAFCPQRSVSTLPEIRWLRVSRSGWRSISARSSRADVWDSDSAH